MRECLFTIAAEYDGGTFISQCASSDPESALAWWAREEMQRIPSLKLDKKMNERIQRRLAGEGAPALLDGMRNVWCGGSATIRGKSLLLNIVQTEKEANQTPEPTRPAVGHLSSEDIRRGKIGG